MEYSQANGVWQAKAMGLRSFDEDRKQASTRQGGPEARDSCKRSSASAAPAGEPGRASLLLRVCPPYFFSLGEGFLDFTAACKSFAFYPGSFKISITPSFPRMFSISKGLSF